MSIVRNCLYDESEKCKYEIFVGEPNIKKCKFCNKNSVNKRKQVEEVNMFEKEADYIKARKESKDKITKVISAWSAREETIHDEGFQDGAEFGYNKANEWHYVKDGDLPKENEYIMIYSKLADNIAVGKRRCAGKIRKRCVYEWYFATYEVTYCLRDKDVIAWKEIVLPELTNEIK